MHGFSTTSKPKYTKASDMAVGDIGIVREAPLPLLSKHAIGQPLMRTYNSWVLLTQPGYTWTKVVEFEVELLQAGESITLTIDDIPF